MELQNYITMFSSFVSKYFEVRYLEFRKYFPRSTFSLLLVVLKNIMSMFFTDNEDNICDNILLRFPEVP